MNYPAVRRPRVLVIAAALLALMLCIPPVAAQGTGPTPTPPAPQLTVLAASLNVRSGPGPSYAVIGKSGRGERFTVTGRDKAMQWWQMDYQGRAGWVSASLVRADPGASGAPVISVAAPGKVAADRAAAAVTPTGPPLPPYQDAVTLGGGTTYPVRGRSVSGWGYELVDESKDFDLLVQRDVFGLFLSQQFPDLLKRHPKGIRITFEDAQPGTNYASRYANDGGFGDGESAYIVAHRCQTEHEEHNSIWQNELVDCRITLVAPGPGLTDIAVTATVLGYARTAGGWGSNPVFDRAPFTQLGQATRDAESGQWRWANPFLQVVSLRPAAAPAAAAPTAPKGPLPPPAGHIAFTRGRDNNGPTPAGVSDIAVVDVKTGEVRVLAPNGRQPDMRNDGRIVFNGEGGGRDDLQVVDLDGSNVRAISMHPEDSAPDWSSGGAIAFHSALAGPDRIFVQWNGDQRGEPQFLEVDNGANLRPFTGRYPVWVGDRVAYTGCDEWAQRSVCGLRRVDVGALLRSKSRGAVELLTKNPEDRATDAAGATILFASPKSGNWNLYTIATSGGKARALTSTPSQDLGGSFSPDGNYIAFMSNNGGWGIWIMEADGANPRRLIAVPEGFGKLWDQDRVSWGP